MQGVLIALLVLYAGMVYTTFKNEIQAKENGKIGWGFLSLFVPIVGFIIWIAVRRNDIHIDNGPPF